MPVRAGQRRPLLAAVVMALGQAGDAHRVLAALGRHDDAQHLEQPTHMIGRDAGAVDAQTIRRRDEAHADRHEQARRANYGGGGQQAKQLTSIHRNPALGRLAPRFIMQKANESVPGVKP